MFRLCDHDPLLDELRNIFRAQPIRIPEARIILLTVFVQDSQRFEFIGYLGELVTPATATNLAELKPKPDSMSEVKSRRSGKVKADLGIEILEGFLEGFGISGCLPSLRAQLSRANTVSFAFREVRRLWVSPAAIGGALKARSFEVDNALIRSYLTRGRDVEFFVVDSTIMSRDFTVSVEETRGAGVSLKVAEIEGIAKVGAGVEFTEGMGRELTFTGPEALPFAFTCNRVSFDAREGNVRLAPCAGTAYYSTPPVEEELPEPRHAVLARRPFMLEWGTSTTSLVSPRPEHLGLIRRDEPLDEILEQPDQHLPVHRREALVRSRGGESRHRCRPRRYGAGG